MAETTVTMIVADVEKIASNPMCEGHALAVVNLPFTADPKPTHPVSITLLFT